MVDVTCCPSRIDSDSASWHLVDVLAFSSVDCTRVEITKMTTYRLNRHLESMAIRGKKLLSHRMVQWGIGFGEVERSPDLNLICTNHRALDLRRGKRQRHAAQDFQQRTSSSRTDRSSVSRLELSPPSPTPSPTPHLPTTATATRKLFHQQHYTQNHTATAAQPKVRP